MELKSWNNMTSQTNHENTYADRNSWVAYASLYWCSKQYEIDNTVNQIIKCLPNLKDKTEISILVLGMGVGTFELPLLRVLKEKAKREIKLVAIDLYKQPLYFASHLVAEGLENLPNSTDEFVARILSSKCSHYWDSPISDNYKIIGDNLFVIDNLDEDENHTPDWDNLVIFKSTPPNWKKRLLQNHEEFVPVGGFDIVISSFCLFHLPNWWRFTLVNALSLLKPGGLFLHSRIEGDVEMIEGYQSSAYKLLPELKEKEYSHSNEIMKQVFLEGLCKDTQFVNYLKNSRPANAVQPFAINEFLSHLQPEVENIFDTGYAFQNEVGKEIYLNIIRKGTCSPTRLIKDRLGEVRFDILVNSIEQKLSKLDLDIKDRIIGKVMWMGFQRSQSVEDFENSPIVQKFING